MSRVSMSWFAPWTLALAGAVLFAGCTGAAPEPAQSADDADPGATSAVVAVDDAGWWCTEHGVPEEVCARCSSQVAKDFQEKGDWCEEHNRAESQCFICHPELETKFAEQYATKFGQQPPKPTE